MCDEWMPGLKLPLTLDQFHQLPRNAAYKYEYLHGQAYLSPRPKHYHAVLDLTAPAAAEGEAGDPVAIRRAQPADLPVLERPFAAAFARVQPFASLEETPRREAARLCLARTGSGGDGPWIEQASFVALGGEPAHPIGAILITLLPESDPCDWDSYYWNEPPPPDCIPRRLGRPHLTWIFVAPLRAGHGVGTALLTAAVRELLSLGFTHLASTFLLGNDSSMLWHWRNGFRLLAYPGSWRLIQRRLRKLT